MRGVWLPLSFIPSFLVLTAILSNGDGRCPLPFTVDPAGVGAVPGEPEAGEMVVCLDSDVKTNERMKRKNPAVPPLHSFHSSLRHDGVHEMPGVSHPYGVAAMPRHQAGLAVA